MVDSICNMKLGNTTMVKLGYALSSEEHAPNDLVKHAVRAEEVGFTFGLISDHFHPWVDKQGQNPMVWSVLGGIAAQTKTIRMGTGVTCPMIRIHPAIIAQAAATVACMMPGRFFLGVGTGENLNEHILGDKWPPIDTRLEMLEESVEVMRQLWEGGMQSFSGQFYDVENARLYTLPEEPIEVYVAASGEKSALLAGQIGDGFINTAPDAEPIDTFEQSGGQGKPKMGMMAVCWAKDEKTAKATALEWWPNAALKGQLSQELALPAHFEQATQDATEDQVAEKVVCGPDSEKYLEKMKAYADAGYDHIYFHQVGPDQEGFFKFYEKELAPRWEKAVA